jgi:hypothetical protein
VRQGEDPEQLFKRQLRPKFVGLQDFLDRPLSLSMDRSPLARRALGLLKAIAVTITVQCRVETTDSHSWRQLILILGREYTKVPDGLNVAQVGGTAMAGTCLLAPASAAALMPAAVAAAVMSPPAAVGSTAAGVFLSSLLQSHTQVQISLRTLCPTKLAPFSSITQILILMSWAGTEHVDR